MYLAFPKFGRNLVVGVFMLISTLWLNLGHRQPCINGYNLNKVVGLQNNKFCATPDITFIFRYSTRLVQFGLVKVTLRHFLTWRCHSSNGLTVMKKQSVKSNCHRFSRLSALQLDHYFNLLEQCLEYNMYLLYKINIMK